MAQQQATEKANPDHRPLRLRMRPDLQCNRQTFQGGDFWIIKDPLSMRYFRFYEEEYFLLKLLDGKRSAEEIQKEFHRQFAPQRLALTEVHQLVGMLFRSSLVISDAPDNGDQLLRRQLSRTRSQRKAAFASILSYRLPGFDPGKILDGLLGWTGWFFTLPAFLFVAFIGLFALTIVGTHFEEFQQKLPSFDQFFAAQNWLWLAIVLSVTKVVHELGHGLACKKFGSQCHEMGVMFLVLTPCLYCNVSDSWTIPSKWKRIFISAAGMYVELAMAAVATIIWWYSVPGMVHYMALNVVFVCGVSTLLFNLNPLLRYDGYYILADLLEIPNLRQKSTRLLESKAGQFFLGLPKSTDPFLPTGNTWLFVLYSVAAAVYRWVLTATIFWFLYRLLEPYGLTIISQGLALFSIYGLFVMPLIKVYKFFSIPGRMHAVKPLRLVTTACVLGAILLGILWIPAPHYIDMPVYVQPKGVKNVYVQTDGRLEKVCVKPGDKVEKGQLIVQLSNIDLQVHLAEAKGEVAQSQIHYQKVNSLVAVGDEKAPYMVRPAEAQVNNAKLALHTEARKIEHLQITAPLSGTVLPADSLRANSSEDHRLNGLVGHVLEPRNRSAFLRKQSVVCKIAPDLKKWEALILVDQSEVEFAKNGQQTKIWLAGLPGEIFRAEIQEVAVDPVDSIPAFLAGQNGGPIPARSTADGSWKPTSEKFLVKVALDPGQHRLLNQSSGIARIHVGYRTVGQRVWRFLAHTFRFEL